MDCCTVVYLTIAQLIDVLILSWKGSQQRVCKAKTTSACDIRQQLFISFILIP
jgi:hypothetical protein